MVSAGMSAVSSMAPSVIVTSVISVPGLSVSSAPVAWTGLVDWRGWAAVGGLAGDVGRGGNPSSILAVWASGFYSSLLPGPSTELQVLGFGLTLTGTVLSSGILFLTMVSLVCDKPIYSAEYSGAKMILPALWYTVGFR